MITINGKTIKSFVEEEKRKEITCSYVEELASQASSNKTRRDSYFCSRRVVNRPLFDKKQKSGKVKQFSKEEIKRMNKINQLTQNERWMLEAIDSFPGPATKAAVLAEFFKQHPNAMSRKSVVSFDNIFNKLDMLDLATKLMRQKGVFSRHQSGKFLFLESNPKISEGSVVEQKLQEKQQEDKPVTKSDPPYKYVSTETDIHNTIVEWMNRNNIFEFSISIKKG